MGVPTSTDTLWRLIRQKRRLLEQIVALTRRQDVMIANAETAGLIELLSGKQQLIAGLQSIERGLDQFRQDDPERRQWADPQEREACRADSDACNAILAEILEIEQRHQRVMQTRREEVAGRLRSVQSAHVAATAYKTHLTGKRPQRALDSTPADAGTLNLTTRD